MSQTLPPSIPPTSAWSVERENLDAIVIVDRDEEDRPITIRNPGMAYATDSQNVAAAQEYLLALTSHIENQKSHGNQTAQ